LTNLSKRFRALIPIGAALVVVAVGTAVAAGTAGASRSAIHAAAYRLTATLTPGQEVPAVQAPTSASGHFEGVLIRSGIGVTKVAALAGCKVITAPRGSGLPTRISCGGSVVALPAAGQWRLIWRLSVSGLSGPAIRTDIHMAVPGHAAPAAFALCGPCQSVSHGHVVLAAGQANALGTNAAYVNVATAANPGGEIRGQITRTTIGFSAGR
jgi:CHRD domain